MAVLLSIFLLQNMAFAATDTNLLVPSGSTTMSETGTLFTDEKLAQMKKDQKDASLTDGIMLGFLLDIFNAVHLNSLPSLIFGNPYGDTGTLNYGIFSQGEMEKIVNPLLGLLTGLYALILTIAIMVSAAKFGIKAYSPQAKADFWTDINMWILSAFFMSSFWLIFKVMMSLNLAFVTTLYSTLKATGIDTNGVSLIGAAGNFNIGNGFIYLCEFGLTLYLNVIYVARKVIIIFLVVLSPFAAYSLMFPKTRAFFGTWIKELAGNIFLQTIHAITIFVFAELAGMAGTGPFNAFATIYKLSLLIMFIPITGMISKWLNLGDSSSKLGQVATTMGVGSVTGAMMLAKGAGNMMGGKRAGGGMSAGGASGASGIPGPGTDMGSDSGVTALTQAAKGGGGWQKFRSIAENVGAVAGGTMGLTMGPAGTVVGAKLGGSVLSGAAQGARNLAAGSTNAIRTAKSSFFPEGMKSAYQASSGSGFFSKVKDMGSTGGKNFNDMWNNLSQRRNFMGNMGESIGSTVGVGGVGRKIGHMASGASRNRIQGADERFGGMNDMSLPDLSQKYAGRDVSWEQTNSGSAFYVNSGNGKQRISNYGAADPTLKKGETRMADYKFPGHNEKFERQPNGSYKLPSTQPVQGYAAGSSVGSVGMAGGSSEHLARTSGSYIRGTDGAKYDDNRVEAAKITPDNYFAHNIKGTDRRDWSDKGADLLTRKTSINTEYKKPTDHTKRVGNLADMAKRDKNRTKNTITL
nr:hypothetical protein [Paenibacillus periandrae]